MKIGKNKQKCWKVRQNKAKIPLKTRKVRVRIYKKPVKNRKNKRFDITLKENLENREK